MKLNILDIGGKIVKDDEKYIVKDNSMLNNLVISSTDLKPGKSTSGHSHAGQEEVYHFVRGSGMMKVDDEVFPVKEGDVFLVNNYTLPHWVFNGSDRERIVLDISANLHSDKIKESIFKAFRKGFYER